jgi:hypothetical protein
VDKKYKLTNVESETIINYSLEDAKVAELYTCISSDIRKMDKLCAEYPDVFTVIKQDEYSKTYRLPRSRISIRRPNKKMDDETKARLVAQLNAK